jgi:LuxR family maltose regulon positive regulatory protein
MLAALQSPQQPSLELLLTGLINELTENAAWLCVVLDDYHLVTSIAIHNAVAFLLDHAPPGLHLVLATRADPALPLALLRGRGALTELSVDDLRFTSRETAAFLSEKTGLILPAELVLALEQRTEGWITGLQLAVLALQGIQSSKKAANTQACWAEPAAFVQGFSGSNRYVLDYLTE